MKLRFSLGNPTGLRAPKAATPTLFDDFTGEGAGEEEDPEQDEEQVEEEEELPIEVDCAPETRRSGRVPKKRLDDDFVFGSELDNQVDLSSVGKVEHDEGEAEYQEPKSSPRK